AEVAPDDLGQPLQGGIQLRNHLRSRPLLRPVNGACTLRAGQRVIYIGRHLDLGLFPIAKDAPGVDPGQALEGSPSRWQPDSVLIEQVVAESLGHPGATVIRGATTNATDEPAGARALGLCQQVS